MTGWSARFQGNLNNLIDKPLENTMGNKRSIKEKMVHETSEILDDCRGR